MMSQFEGTLWPVLAYVYSLLKRGLRLRHVIKVPFTLIREAESAAAGLAAVMADIASQGHGHVSVSDIVAVNVGHFDSHWLPGSKYATGLVCLVLPASAASWSTLRLYYLTMSWRRCS